MRTHIALEFDFDEKQHPEKKDEWGDPLTYWECPNCGAIETSLYRVEERGAGTHTITECFQALRERTDLLEQRNDQLEQRVGSLEPPPAETRPPFHI